ncbi:uncharacterized protein Nmag_2596 [Natrialba magadii ATCC 43099]|uniref:Uncharacterized protein n=1 Tax=Natrialba magadii (strain ATCC 43099 / DSM 3394 / CCM 3739 / CIP 104546 / IAM 13178 / JCM 8861 / NBRC 102185 / NCIMB 2190 / MS3) TaxID=547559 RepID=D3SYW3_NATMM|nr:hypothetical protein [Natrialba magadii]ADD06155.1 uncharacterized protein Nmag_2596 [Natrialba magadii ATCC 43099]
MVPARWYDNLTKARNVYYDFLNGDNIHNHQLSDDNVKGVWVSAGTIDGQKPFIEIESTSDETLPLGYVESNGVPIKVTNLEPKEKAEDSDKDPNKSGRTEPQSNYIGGGDRCGNGDGSAGTLATPVWKSGNASDRYFLTCEHIGAEMSDFGDELFRTGGGLSEGDKLHTGGSSFSSEIGEVIDASCSNDFAVVDPEDGYTPDFSINGESSPIVGSISKDGLSDMESNGEQVKKSGQVTGVTSGEVKAYNGTVFPYLGTCGTRRTNQLRWGTEDDSKDGDSGSPVYTDEYTSADEILIAGGLDGGWPSYGYVGDYAFGTAAYVLHQDYDYRFSDPSYRPRS